ncbi:MAG: hypothetical protein ACXW3S_09385, partial [Rhodoplanes sp.]
MRLRLKEVIQQASKFHDTFCLDDFLSEFKRGYRVAQGEF